MNVNWIWMNIFEWMYIEYKWMCLNKFIFNKIENIWMDLHGI